MNQISLILNLQTPVARDSPALNRSVNKLFSSSQRLLTRSSLVFGDSNVGSNTDEPFVTSNLSDEEASLDDFDKFVV